MAKTNEEAIADLEDLRGLAKKCLAEVVDDSEEILNDFAIGAQEYYDALEVAIKALKERENQGQSK